MFGKVITTMIRCYQFCSRSFMAPSCRYVPSCSNYAIGAFEKHGFFIGFVLTAWRLLKCNPFVKGGIDLVPESLSLKKRTNDETK